MTRLETSPHADDEAIHQPQDDEPFVAIDLGSNSFHMIVARVHNGQIKIVDRLREMVRLAAGLDKRRTIRPEVQQRALDCLSRFGQRIADAHSSNVRAVGTNTLRSARNSSVFLSYAEQALGHPIEIISGVEEARLIYLGVAHSVAASDNRRLVVDIGGGSTELIIGQRFEPMCLESLYMGCVSMSEAYFRDGRITRKRIRRAEIAARVELEHVETRYRELGWEEAIGASGTIRAVHNVVKQAGWSEHGITLQSLRQLLDTLLGAGSIEACKLAGLDPERAPVFPGGVVVLLAVFEALGIERMAVADGALREGLLYDLLGRIRHEDVRDRSVRALAERYHVSTEQADRVAATARRCLAQVSNEWKLNEDDAQALSWAARLHEIGLDIAHSGYHKHGAYIIGNAELAGFSRQEQQFLAALVHGHRRKFPVAVFKTLPGRDTQRAERLAVLLRLAVMLHRSHSANALPDMTLNASKRALDIHFPPGWLEEHPLTQADLEQEARNLKLADFKLSFV